MVESASESCRRPRESQVRVSNYTLVLQVATIKLMSSLDLPHIVNNVARNQTSLGIMEYIHLMDKNGPKEPKTSSFRRAVT